MQRRRLRRLDCGKRDHQNRLGIMERGRRIELEVQRIAVLRGQRRNVLVDGRMKGIHDARDIDNRGDIRAVVAEIRLRRVAGLHGEITCGSRGERVHDGHAVAVVQD